MLDGTGKVIRSFTNQKDKTYQKYEGGPAPKLMLPAQKGLNRLAWDMRREALPGVSKVFVNGDYRGSLVGPGTYTLQLITDKDTSTTTATIMPDPRLDAALTDYVAQQAVLTKTEDAVREIHEAVNTMRNAKTQIEALQASWKSDTTMKAWQTSGKDLIKKITTWEDGLITPKQQTFQDVINFPNRLNAGLLDLRGRASNHDPRPSVGVEERLAELLAEWNTHKMTMQKIVQEDVAKFNADYEARRLPAVYIKP